MELRARFAPQNGIVFVLDPDTGDLPDSMEGAVAASDSAVVVGTLNEYDGETTVVLATPGDLPEEAGLELRWRGVLPTSGRIGIVDATNATRLETPAAPRVHVAVWTNDDVEPDLVWVQVSEEEQA